jgi:hypothetical protein
MTPPLLVVGHGTRSDDGVADFGRLVDRLGRRLAVDGVDVAGGFIELAPPPVTEAVGSLVERGHRRVSPSRSSSSRRDTARGTSPRRWRASRSDTPG